MDLCITGYYFGMRGQNDKKSDDIICSSKVKALGKTKKLCMK